MKDTEDRDIHTCFKLHYFVDENQRPQLDSLSNEESWGPYFSLREALEASELLHYWVDVGRQTITKMVITEYLIREYGLEPITEKMTILPR